jgi:hypothetical protein
VNRRRFLLSIVSLTLVAGTRSTTASPSAVVQSKGLGLTYGELEHEFGRPVVDAKRGNREFMGVMSEDLTLHSLLLTSPPRHDADIPHQFIIRAFAPAPRTVIERAVAIFYPADAERLDEYATEAGDAVVHYVSQSLRDRMAGEPSADHPKRTWPNAEPGEFILVYFRQGGSLNPDHIEAVGFAFGNDPAMVDR